MKPLRMLAASLLCLPPVAAFAACNNPSNWLESPRGNDVKVFIGYEQEFKNRFTKAPDNDTPAFPPPLPQEILHRTTQGSLPKDAEGKISYYEPDGKGQWRLCRREKWISRQMPDWGTETTRLQLSRADKIQIGNANLASVMPTHGLQFAYIYEYDLLGRLHRTLRSNFYGEDEKPVVADVQCYQYNDFNKITQYVAARTHNVCPSGEPDPRDSWSRTRFASFKNEQGKTEVSPIQVQEHLGNPDGTWTEYIQFTDSPQPTLQTPSGKAFVKPGKGVIKILGGNRIGLKDESNIALHPYDSGNLPPIEYYFTKPPVPVSILEDLEQQLYNYDRRREVDALSHIKLVEFYPAHVHRPRDRFYVSPGGVLRQEQYDPNGKLRRVINVAFVRLHKNNGGFYDEDLSGQITLKLKLNELVYRVWEYDDAGKGKLVAIGWNTKLGTAINREPLDIANLAFGTPDGKVRWKSKEEFFKAFDFDPYASRAYPEQGSR